MEKIMRHLVIGWSGFVTILLDLTLQGERIPPDCLARLMECQATIADVVRMQNDKSKDKPEA
jgi:hypothetical protein